MKFDIALNSLTFKILWFKLFRNGQSITFIGNVFPSIFAIAKCYLIIKGVGVGW